MSETEPLPDLQAAFLAWLDDVRPRLAVAIDIQRSTPEVTEFSFELANPVLDGALTGRGDLVVSVEWVGECWDFLFSAEVRPRKTAGGFVCSLCEPEGKHRVFPNVEALYHDHIFRPFEEWVNTKLTVAQALALYRTDDAGATWARLVSAGGQTGSAIFLVSLK